MKSSANKADDFDSFDFKNPTAASNSGLLKLSSLGKKVAICILIAAICALAALTASIPKPEPYGETDIDKMALVNSGDTAWIIVASALVLLMTPGLAFFYGGMVNHKNVISTIYQSYVSMGLISVLWVLIGFSLAFGEDANGSGILGTPATYFMFNNVGANPEPTLASSIPLTIFSMFQLMFAMITPILISGALAERVNFTSWLLFLGIWHLVVYCPLAHIVWHPEGHLRKWGYQDFAGGLVVEMASGYGALAAAVFLGPRKETEGSHANIPFIMLGTGLLWFGWLGFNAGSALAANGLACQTFATTNTAGASAMVMWIFLDFLMGRPSSAVGACNGIVVGLVAITPACGYVTVGGAMCIGYIACIVCYTAGELFKERTGIDDSLDVFSIHGLGGTCGVILTSVFTSKHVNSAAVDGLVYGNGEIFGKHIAVVVVSIPLIMIATYGCCVLTNAIIPMRVSEEEEMMGLDMSMHGESLAGKSAHSKSLHDRDRASKDDDKPAGNVAKSEDVDISKLASSFPTIEGSTENC